MGTAEHESLHDTLCVKQLTPARPQRHAHAPTTITNMGARSRRACGSAWSHSRCRTCLACVGDVNYGLRTFISAFRPHPPATQPGPTSLPVQARRFRRAPLFRPDRRAGGEPRRALLASELGWAPATRLPDVSCAVHTLRPRVRAEELHGQMLLIYEEGQVAVLSVCADT